MHCRYVEFGFAGDAGSHTENEASRGEAFQEEAPCQVNALFGQ
jgi:hypothetical protein